MIQILKKINFINFHIKNLNKFDEITRIRLIVMGISFFIMEMFIPIVTEFKGKFLYIEFNNKIIYPATIIAILGIAKTIAEKGIPYLLDHTSFVAIFKLKITIEVLMLFSLFLFFIDKRFFVFVDSIMGILLSIVIIIYSSTLTNYISFFHNTNFANFQNYRFHLIAETTLVGLSTSALLSYIDKNLNIIFAIILFTFLIIYEIRKIESFKKMNFRYMFMYHKNKKMKKEKK